MFVQCIYPQVSSSFVYSFGSYRVDKQTHKQTDAALKTSNVRRYATTLGNEPYLSAREMMFFILMCYTNRPYFTFYRASSYASAVLEVVILSVHPSAYLSVCPSHACFVTKRNNALRIFSYRTKGQPL